MKILQVLPVQAGSGFSVSGAEIQIFRLAMGLAKEGLSSSVLILGEHFAEDMQNELERLKQENVDVHVIPWAKVQNPSSLIGLKKKLSELDVDLVHAHLIPAELSVPWLSKGKKCMVTLHNDDPERLALLKKTAHRLSLQKMDQILCISERIREYLKSLSIQMNDVQVLEYGMEKPEFLSRDEVREEYAISKETLAFVCLARFVEQKDHATLLESLALVKRTHKQVKLYLFGAGPLEANLKEQVKALGLEEDVVFVGYVPHASKLLKGFDCFVMTSLWEGLGLVFVEAMMAECPVIATRAGAIENVLDDIYQGQLVEVKNSEQLSKRILQWIEKPFSKDELKDVSARAKIRFSPKRYIDEHINIYRKVLQT